MNYTEELRGILENYRDAVERVEKNKKPYDGLLGMGKKPSDDACHEQMDQAVAALMRQAAGESGDSEKSAPRVDSAEADALVFTLLQAEKSYRGPEYARIAMVAAQRHCISVIPGMTPEGRRELYTWYDHAYPRRMRFPVQKQIMEALAG